VIHGSDWSSDWANTALKIWSKKYYGRCKSPQELDAQSVAMDWAMIGYDLEQALKEIERKELITAE
jgi:carbamate kinase